MNYTKQDLIYAFILGFLAGIIFTCAISLIPLTKKPMADYPATDLECIDEHEKN